jgi:LysM repeat protein
MPSDRRRRRRSPARWIAPLALLVAGVAVYSVVDPGSVKDKTTTTTTQGTTRTGTTTTTSAPKAKKKARTYTVKAGDTLSGIAGKTGVSLTRIETLNPKLDSQSLQTGETIKLGP